MGQSFNQLYCSYIWPNGLEQRIGKTFCQMFKYVLPINMQRSSDNHDDMTAWTAYVSQHVISLSA